MASKIPVTVLTGFLGSGKTTLLNRILSEEHGLRIAVIENEFGEIGIDQELVINADEEIFEMNNGCICCTVRGDLIRILGDLAQRKEKFDRVILETTGMADPGPVAQTFFVDDNIREQYELDGIITLVDAKHIGQHLDANTEEVLSQLAFADRIILNKIDLISDTDQHSLKKRLQSINQMAELYSATMANAPVAELLNIGGFNLEHALERKPSFLEPEYAFEWGGIWQLPAGEYNFKMAQGPDPEMSIAMLTSQATTLESLPVLAEQIFIEFSNPPQPLYHQQAISNPWQHYQLMLQGRDEYEFSLSLDSTQPIALFTQHTPEEFALKLVAKDGSEQIPVTEHFFNAEHSHDSTVSSVAIEIPGLFDYKLINDWIDMFLQVHGENVYRMKGVVGIRGENQRIVFQGVHMIFGSQAGKPWGNEPPINRMVFIGKNLDERYIRNSLQSCLSLEIKRDIA